MGGVIFHIYYGLIESKILIILTKYMSSERTESQVSIFGDRSNNEREMYTFVTETFIKKMSIVWMAPGGCLWYNA